MGDCTMKLAPTAQSGDIPSIGVMRRISKAHYTLAGITILGALLRLHYLGAESLWFDESASVAIAHLDWRNLWKVVSLAEANMVLYYGLLHVWLSFGESEFVVRSLSVLAGVLTVPLIYAIGKRMFGTRVGLVSAVLLATNVFHIKYSQEARGYSLVVLLAALSSLFFIRAMENGSRHDWIGYVLTSTLAVYAHFFGVLVLGAQWISIVLLRPRDVPWRKLLISVSVIGIFLLPLAVFVLTKDTGQVAWISKPRIYDIYGLLDSLAGGGRPLGLAYFIFGSVALLVALRAWVHSGASFDNWRYGFLLSWLFVPILTVFAISFVKPMFVNRFLIVCLPALLLLVAIGVCQIRERWLFAGGLAVLLLLSVHKIHWSGTQLEKEDWRGATTYVLSDASPKDGVLFYTSYGRLGFDYYARRLNPGSETVKVAFPDRLDLSVAARLDPDDYLLASLPQKYEQIWLFVRFNELDPELLRREHSIEAILSSEYPNAVEKTFRGMRVMQYSRAERTLNP
jgi:mannosyltransferase